MLRVVYLWSFLDQWNEQSAAVAEKSSISWFLFDSFEQFLQKRIRYFISLQCFFLYQKFVIHANWQNLGDFRWIEIALSLIAEQGILRYSEIFDKRVKKLGLFCDNSLKCECLWSLYEFCEGGHVWYLNYNNKKVK